MSSATVTETRQARIDKFVVLDALQGVVAVLVADIPDGCEDAHAHGISSDDLVVGQGPSGLDTDRSLCDELWPSNQELDSIPEFIEANSRARMLEARLLIYLARSSDKLLEHAADDLDRLGALSPPDDDEDGGCCA